MLRPCVVSIEVIMIFGKNRSSGGVEWLLVCLGNPGDPYENTCLLYTSLYPRRLHRLFAMDLRHGGASLDSPRRGM